MGRKNLSPIVITQSMTRRTETMDQYFTDIKSYKLLSPEKEVELVREYKDGNERAGEILITANLRFVVSVAKQYQNRGVPLSDLISAGNIGLVRAMKKFDDSRGFKLISYAVWWIRQSVLQEIADHGRTIRLPLNVQTVNNKHWRETGENLPEITALEMYSLDYMYEDTDTQLIDKIESTDFDKPDDVVLGKSYIIRVLEKMSPKEQLVIKMRYGIGYMDTHTFDEIADRLGGLTRERARQIHEKAMRRLKSHAGRLNRDRLFNY